MRLAQLVIGILITSCASQRMVETSLYFGQSRPDGGVVTAEEWARFHNEYVLKVFREGATAIPVSGNWYDPDKRHLISEPVYIVVYLHKPSTVISREIDNLGQQYIQSFGQQAVMRVDKKVKATFMKPRR